MKKTILLLLFPICVYAQEIYNSQAVYNDPMGLFDESVIRDLSIDFYDIDYNNFLIQSWFDNTKL